MDARAEIQPTDVPVDRARFREVTDDDELFASELAELFLADLRERAARIEEAAAAGNREELKREAHRLKGMSANVGAVALEAMGAALERLADEAAIAAEAADHVRRLPGEVKRAAEFFAPYITAK